MPGEPVTPPSSNRRGSLTEIGLVFLKLGTIGFGGPAAHVALMEDEVVRRRGWLTRQQFLDYLGATNLIPGPNSTELAIHIGHLRGGWPGLVVAGLAFILPAMLIVGALAMMYVRYGSVAEVGALLYGVKPVVIALVAQALWGLGRSAVKGPMLAAIGAAAVVAVVAGVHELVVLPLAAVAAMAAGRVFRTAAGLVTLGAITPLSAAAASTSTAVDLPRLFLVFAKIGSVLFGSGYVLLAFLRSELVERLGWLTEAQVLDAVAVGQVTPGPLFTTATFVGVLVGGWMGGLVATAGIFLPAFVFVALSGPLVPRIRRSPVAGAALDGVNVASLALMAVVSVQLGRAALVDGITVVLAVLSGVALVQYKVNSVWLVAAGAAVGLIVTWVG